MVIVSETFNYDECLDLIKLIPDVQSGSIVAENSDFWPVILAIFGQKANKKSFYWGRRVGPSLEDIGIILSKIGDKSAFKEEIWDQMSKVISFLTQKSLNSAETEIEHRTELVKFEVNQLQLSVDNKSKR